VVQPTRACAADVHAGALAHWLKAFKHLQAWQGWQVTQIASTMQQHAFVTYLELGAAMQGQGHCAANVHARALAHGRKTLKHIQEEAQQCRLRASALLLLLLLLLGNKSKTSCTTVKRQAGNLHSDCCCGVECRGCRFFHTQSCIRT
jgi:hypothetical protein